METTPATKDLNVFTTHIDLALDKYDNVVLFPELLAKANALLKKAGPPKFLEPKQ